MRRIFGTTYTDKALQDVRNRGFSPANGGRGKNVDQVVIVITDGVSIIPTATKSAAQALRAMNVEIYAVGIGATDITELYNIGSGSDHVYTIPDFRTLSQIENRLFKEVCRNKTIDGSGGVTPKDGGVTKKGGGATPKDGGVTKKGGGATPKDGGATPKDGGVTPKGGNTTPPPIRKLQSFF
ncbi:COL6A [Acanthosepion pharaonis]|uniref:COL6A n=1 Tax=Acanthosepion pharaonis TaxID=158019 RepID=A0A812B5A9_ACAPH|nr:COL6A [Sepia pharaonis]